MFFRRRIRGILGTAAMWFVSWGGIGAVYWAIDVVANNWRIPAVRDQFLGGLVAVGIFWSVWGAVSGLVFGACVALTQRGRDLTQLRARAMALWGAVSGAAYPGYLWLSAVLNPGAVRMADLPLAVGLGAVAGAVCGAGTLWIARRAKGAALRSAREQALEAGSELSAPISRAHDAVHR